MKQEPSTPAPSQADATPPPPPSVSAQGKGKARRPGLWGYRLEITATVLSLFAFVTGAASIQDIRKWFSPPPPQAQDAALDSQELPAPAVEPARDDPAQRPPAVLVTNLGRLQPEALMRPAQRCMPQEAAQALNKLLAPSIAANLTKHIEQAVAQSLNLWFVTGPEVGRGGQPYMIQFWNGYVYATPLSLQQAATMGVRDDAVIWWDADAVHGQAGDARLEITRVEIEDAMPLSIDRPIRGRLGYRMLESAEAEVGVGLSLGKAGQTITRIDYAGVIDGAEGEVAFAFEPLVSLLAGADAPDYAVNPGPILVFFCVVDISAETPAFEPLCDPVGVLIDME